MYKKANRKKKGEKNAGAGEFIKTNVDRNASVFIFREI
jgi:hypothetical protein